MRKEFKTYYDNGKIYHKYDIFDEDKDDYVLTGYDLNESIIMLAVFKSSKFHGVKSTYNSSGTIITKKTYKSISRFNMGFENGIQIELTYA